MSTNKCLVVLATTIVGHCSRQLCELKVQAECHRVADWDISVNLAAYTSPQSVWPMDSTCAFSTCAHAWLSITMTYDPLLVRFARLKWPTYMLPLPLFVHNPYINQQLHHIVLTLCITCVGDRTVCYYSVTVCSSKRQLCLWNNAKICMLMAN